MKTIYLKKATIADIPILLDIEKSVSGTKIYSPMLEEKKWKEELEFPKSVVYLIKKNSIVVGNVTYEKKNKGSAHIGGLVVNPNFQRQGIARKAMVLLLEELKNVKRVDLVTHPHNTRAIMLYLSLGFVIESWKNDYYGDGEPRIVMVRILKSYR